METFTGTMTTLLIDADGVAFRAAAAVQTSIQWDDDIITTHADLNDAKDAFDAQIAKYNAAAAGIEKSSSASRARLAGISGTTSGRTIRGTANRPLRWPSSRSRNGPPNNTRRGPTGP